MKKTILIILVFISILSSCEGSDSYQGNWKAIDENGAKCEINFSPKSFSVKDNKGKSKTYEYTQNSVNIENSVETYGIQLNDGRAYLIRFPLKDENVGIILDENGKPAYIIGRKNYITYDDIYKLN